jgi:hypothetical protein
MEALYRIEEFTTTGWELIDEKEVRLTKEVCSQHIQTYINEGVNPNLLRVVVDA